MLAPKVSNPIHINRSSVQKFSKVLATRLSKVIEKIISHEQSAFIQNRQILDGPLMMSEVIDWYKEKNKKLLIFKVDFEKAFDSVNWWYLDFVQSQLGFGSQLRKWIQAFMEGIHIAINEVVQTNIIRGAFVGVVQFNISHFFFADDVVIVTEWSNNHMDNLKQVLYVFHLASGLKINMHKSNVFGVGVPTEDVVAMACGTKLAIHGEQVGFDFKRCKTQGIWDKIVGYINYLHSTRVILHGSFKLKVGDGSNVRFWKDTWLGDAPLEARYNRLFHLDTHPNDSWQWSWCRQSLGGNNNNSLSLLLNDLHGFQLGSGLDFWQWNLDVDCCFTVSGARHHLDDFFLHSLS
ncbi:RNA-directed DNA polymerase, eukaryota, reverse transcriptase zinc-binding domain protein [Tanacetum coccineum]|uniref:RNA-directed DNA polymerase, eukaryota, reverse transcriptase zinc-binding domain protein n=1 Tax=Tanacetum coccineum TaxID=301880 RepID=A0ABQ4ZK27_9ASTR